VKKAETLIETDDVRVRVLELSPGQTNPWHYHTEITDHMVGLSGDLLVRLRDPAEEIALAPGSRCQVATGRVHQVLNRSTLEPAQYLLVQGVGRYDFIQVKN
jgi:quercetin dioxygenase-like cupin family protein